MIYFKIQENKLEPISPFPPVNSGSENYDKCSFEFSPEWKNRSVTVVFRRSSAIRHTILDSQGECYIPIEMISENGTFFVGVFGLENGRVVSTNEFACPVRNGAAVMPIPPSETIYAEIINELASLRRTVEEIIESRAVGTEGGGDGQAVLVME